MAHTKLTLSCPANFDVAEKWVHFFEPVRKIESSMWVTKNVRRPVGAKRTKSTKNAVYAIFFSCDGIAIQAPVPKGRSATGRYNCYMYVVLKKLKFTTRHDVHLQDFNMFVYCMTMPQHIHLKF